VTEVSRILPDNFRESGAGGCRLNIPTVQRTNEVNGARNSAHAAVHEFALPVCAGQQSPDEGHPTARNIYPVIAKSDP